MTDTTRDLIQRLADELYKYECLTSRRPPDYIPAPSPLIDEARAYLAQPEPEGPTDEELEDIARAAEIQHMKEHGGLAGSTPDGIHAQLRAQRIAGLRAVAARCGRPAIQLEPEGLTDEEILDLSGKHGVSYTTLGGVVIHPYQEVVDIKDDVLSFARAVIAADRARSGRPKPPSLKPSNHYH